MKTKLDKYAISRGFESWLDLCSNLQPLDIESETIAVLGEIKNEQREVHLNLNESWSTIHLMIKLIEASEILLNERNYDGLGWEDIQGAVKRSKELITKIINYEKNNNNC